MRKIRRLYLQNEKGERRGFNGEGGVYATNLAGFGFSLEPKFSDLGRGFFPTVSSNAEPQNTLAFTIVMTRNPYTTYYPFVNWLAAAEKLTMVYDPTGTQEYFRDVSVGFLQKGELTQMGWLELLSSFDCLTPWYRPLPTALNISNNNTEDIKCYDYAYTSELRYGSENPASLQAQIVGTGHIPGALTVIVRGGMTNPQLRLVGNLTGKTYGVCSLSVVLEETDALMFSSLYENSYVKKRSADGTETDLLDVLDLSREPFFHIPVNEPCTLSIEADGAFAGRAEMQIYYYYRSV